MAVNFSHPWLLLLLLPAALLLAVYSGRHRYPSGTRALILGMRGFIILCLILALARPHLVLPVRDNSVVFLLDESISVSSEDYSPWVRQSLGAMEARDRAAVVAFGLDSRLRKPFSMTELPQGAAGIDPEFSHLGSALETAYSLLPGSGGRIVLISDGLENIGDSLAMADMLAAAGIAVDVVPLASQPGPEAAITNIALPKNTWPGQEVVAEVTVDSTVATGAELTVFWGSSLAFQGRVDIAPGIQTFPVSLQVQGQSLQWVRAVIDPDTDSEVRNNSMDGLTFVQAAPRVLIVEGTSGKGAALQNTFVEAGISADRLTLAQANLSPVALAGYRAVVLADVPAYGMQDDQLQALESFVRVMGGGLTAVGGKTSFGMGFYQDTLLEQMLPVSMEVEQKEELPGLDMVLVIDRSGSMSGEKLNMAKNAALRALDVLKERDRLGVVTFDDGFTVDCPLTPITDKADIAKGIEYIQVGGGTTIFPALEHAVGMLEGSTRSKHIILLSDGQEGAQYSYEGLLQRAVEQGVSLSTIALGSDADDRHMLYLSELGNGRSYSVSEGEDLPAVFVQETVLAGGDWLVEEDFVPALLHPDAMALAGNTPGFGGYIASTPKPLAEVLMSTHRDHPLLARWQYGLGRAAAFTSDTYGLWSMDFLAHPGFSSLWMDILNWTAPTGQASDIALESRLQGPGVEISALTNRQLEEGESMSVTMLDAQGNHEDLELLPAGGGSYSAKLDQVGQGVYLLSATRTDQDGQVLSQTLGGFAVPYPPEYQIQRYSGRELLETLAEKTGGRVLTAPEEVFAAESAPARRLTEITWWLLLLALVFWPVDIAIRRLGGLPKRKRPGEKAQAADEEAEENSDQTMERLLAAKRRRR